MFGSLAQDGIKPQRRIERRRPSPPARTAARLFARATKSQPGLGVRFITAFHLVHELVEARDEKKLHRLQDLLAKASLLIVDELGYVSLSQTGSAVLSTSSTGASAHGRKVHPGVRESRLQIRKAQYPCPRRDVRSYTREAFPVLGHGLADTAQLTFELDRSVRAGQIYC